ncbi:hypothetical protein ACFV9E_14965 [Streptomyces sp. NPDC059835]|uniref:hypothetical protein n=1 Tax=Streptomyces sp. NPDC059835 TaxID=3346967 RepID=UPI00364EA072
MLPEDCSQLPLRGFGTLTVHTTVLEHGRVRYSVRGPHVHGAFVVVPEILHGGPVIPKTVYVQFGDDTDGGGWYSPRPEEPKVRNARIHGFTDSIDPRTVTRRSHFLASLAVVLRDNGTTYRIPDGARALTEAVIVAIVKDWKQRPDRDDLLLAAARHKAETNAAHERGCAEKQEAELDSVRNDRVTARRRILQVAGLVRRRQPAVLPPALETVSLPFFDRTGARMGVLRVREKEVNALPGRVVYEVQGGRVRGTFAVGPDLYDTTSAIPQGIYVSYGHPSSSADWPRWSHECADEPTVNGVQLSGGWSHGGRSADITTTYPEHLPAQVRLGPNTSTSAPSATGRRASAVLRALALHYLARRDVDALRIATGKHRTAHTRAASRNELDRLRARERHLAASVRRHRTRERQFLDLLTAPAVQDPAPVIRLPQRGMELGQEAA